MPEDKTVEIVRNVYVLIENHTGGFLRAKHGRFTNHPVVFDKIGRCKSALNALHPYDKARAVVKKAVIRWTFTQSRRS